MGLIYVEGVQNNYDKLMDLCQKLSFLRKKSAKNLEADAENLRGTVKELPNREAIDVPVDEMLIVELYSK